MEAADSGEVPLARDQIVGTYVAQGNPGPPVTLLEKDGKPIQQIPGRAAYAARKAVARIGRRRIT